ncbi:MAG: Mrp/NBP35 family ATP-binding protein [Candidatus Marinimicrobia bacterium]|nr:Mrp/NBP35 family ATP-binding protein [Candidatus Neomarinimicrobiota bacterium]
MNRDQIVELLKTVNYPGFSRDIISFGMVSEIKPAGDTVTVKLKILTDQQEKIENVKAAVREVLTTKGGFSNVTIEMEDTSVKPNVGPAAEKDPFAGQSTLPGVKYVVAIASGKGGVGKSTVAANVAATLQLRGKRTGLLDLDIYGPSLPIILGINERPGITDNKKLLPLERFGMQVMSFGFISGNNAPAIWRGPMVAKMVDQFFKDVDWGELDYLILDLPPGTGDVQLTLVQKIKISGAVIVTTPQKIALADVRKSADMFRKVDAPVLGVVENMSGLRLTGRVLDKNKEPITDIILELDEIDSLAVNKKGEFDVTLDLFKRGGGKSESERLNVPLLGEIPLSQALVEATDAGTPIVIQNPDSPISTIYGSITDNIIANLENKG